MSFIHAFVTLASLSAGIVYGQQGEKGNSIIPFPRVGRSDRYFMAEKRSGNSMSPGLIPFPRIGRSDGFHEMKRQLIPFPRVGKRPFWHYPTDAYNIFEYEDYPYMVDPSGVNPMGSASIDPSSTMPDEIDNDKRNNNAEKGMWFGPRLGKRRKRSISESDSYEQQHSRDSVDTKTLVKILRSFNWAIVPVRERRTFTPRLGRSSEEVVVHNRAQPFSPRLGRSREVSSVELDLEEKGQSRLSRSESGIDIRAHDKGTEPPPPDVVMTPRLGRDHFSPRLGRSGEDHE